MILKKEKQNQQHQLKWFVVPPHMKVVLGKQGTQAQSFLAQVPEKQLQLKRVRTL